MPHKDPTARRAYHLAYNRAHRSRYKWGDKTYSAALHANQRAKLYGSPGEITPEDVRTVLTDARCRYCGTTKRLGIDHVVPLHAGGPNVPANLAAACISCNISKYRSDRPGRWSREHDACIRCGTSDVGHCSKGLCFTCYRRERSARERATGRRK